MSNNPRKFLPALRTTSRAYEKLRTLALRIVAYMTTNITIYATPNPTLASVTTQIGNLKTAIGAGGSKTNRGSKASIELIRTEAETLRSMIIALISYAVNTTTISGSQQTNALYNFLLSGISVKKARVQSNRSIDVIRTFKIQTVGSDMSSVTLKWNKPKGLIKGQPAKLYKLEMYNPDSGLWELVATTTKTTFTFSSMSPLLAIGDGHSRITPLNKNGFGQPYTFKLLPQSNTTPPPPFVVTGSLNSNVSTNVNTSTVTYPYPNIKLDTSGTAMDYYLSTSAGALPIMGQPLITVVSGASQSMSIAQLKTTLGWTPTNKFLNVHNNGIITASWTVTLFI